VLSTVLVCCAGWTADVVIPEPGVYVEGKFGVRIENLVAVVPANGLKYAPAAHRFLSFETISLVWSDSSDKVYDFVASSCPLQCPIQLKLIQRDLLSADDVTWLNDYHARCRASLAPLLQVRACARVMSWPALTVARSITSLHCSGSCEKRSTWSSLHSDNHCLLSLLTVSFVPKNTPNMPIYDPL
jgi:hypothetical protein